MIKPVPAQSVLERAQCSADPTDARGLSQLDCPALAPVSSQLRQRERERERGHPAASGLRGTNTLLSSPTRVTT